MKTPVARTLIPSLTKLGYFDGEIVIPIFQCKAGVRDTLRHEYGHALLHHYPEITTRKRFIIFGRTDVPSDYVSPNGILNPSEDFCDTLMAYMKYNGKLPLKYSSKELQKKWRFIASLQRSGLSS